MKLAGAQQAKFPRCVFLDRGAKSFWNLRGPEARQRQVRREIPLFPRNANRFRGLFDIGCKNFQIRRCADPRPEDASMSLVGEKTEPAKIECDNLLGTHPSERSANGGQSRFGNFTDEF